MRFYGLEDWLRTVSRCCHVDQDTLRLKHVDYPAALLCLKAAGGPATSDDPKTDAAERLYRLLVSLVRLRPYRGGKHDIAAAAAARDFAAAIGWTLHLPDRGLTLVHLMENGDLAPDDVRRALRQALRPLPAGPPRGPDRLRGVNVYIAHAVSNPTPALVGLTADIRNSLAAKLRRDGAHVRLPEPRQHVARDGRRDRRRGQSRPARTHELFTISLERLSWCHLLVIINDPQGQGNCVEREWALRLGVPVVELRLEPTVAPHQDGPGRVWTVDVDHERAEDAVAASAVAVRRLLPGIRDHAAMQQALRVKNEAALAHLRGSWQSLRAEDRDWVSRITGMSRAYIEGLLLNATALELASDLQRRQLETVLSVAPPVPPARTSGKEAELLAEAGDEAGLRGAELVRAVDYAAERLVATRQRFDLLAARAAIAAAIRGLGLR